MVRSSVNAGMVTSWRDGLWVGGILLGGWLATAAPVGLLLAMAGLFVAIFCAVRLDQPHSRRDGYRRGYEDGASAANPITGHGETKQ